MHSLRPRIINRRLSIAMLFLVLLTLILITRVGYLQVYRFEYYQTRSYDNRIQVEPTVSIRGSIFARNGELLAGHVTYFDLMYYPEQSKLSEEKLIEFLERVIGLTAREQKWIEQATVHQRQKGILVRQQLNDKQIAGITAHSILESGLEVVTRLHRYYPEGKLLGHVTGYIGKMSEKDIKRIKKNGEKNSYWGIKMIGKTGLERYYEDRLRGISGSRQVEVSASGRIVRVLKQNIPVPGKDLITTIDLALQKVVHQAFAEHKGALVALDPRNGEILALLSAGGYDPNVFIGDNNHEIKRLFNDPDYPLLNRAISGTYPPGSTFKPFVGLVGLSLGKRGLNDMINDPGYFSLPGSSHRYRDWKIGGHGKVNFRKSLVESVDTYYYGLAASLGIDILQQGLALFGFGQVTGLDIPGEKSGLLPSATWKKKRFRQNWLAGDTVSVGVGQGYMLVTPLQIAHAYAILANQGIAYRPHFVQKIKGSHTDKPELIKRQQQTHVPIKPAFFKATDDALQAVNKPGGTAARAFANIPFSVAGKTGTAQVFTLAQDKRYDASKINKKLHDHAWYVGYAPADQPKIVVAAIVENGGHGSSATAPIVRTVIESYLKRVQTTQ